MTYTIYSKPKTLPGPYLTLECRLSSAAAVLAYFQPAADDGTESALLAALESDND